MSNGGSVGSVVHHEHFQFCDVVDNDSLKSMGVHISCNLVTTISNTGHGNGTLETTTDSPIDTLWLTPGRSTNSPEQIRLMTSELLRSLFHDGFLDKGCRTGHGDSVV